MPRGCCSARRKSAGLVDGSRRGTLAGGVGEIHQGLAGEFRHGRIRVSEEKQERSDPIKLTVFYTQHGDRFAHSAGLVLLFGGAAKFVKQRGRPHDSPVANDKRAVSAFLQHAEEIFQAARAGTGDCDLAFFVKEGGGIQVVAAPDGEMEPLRIFHGADAAYRVRRGPGGVRLEGRSRTESCRMETPNPARRVGFGAIECPQYRLIP